MGNEAIFGSKTNQRFSPFTGLMVTADWAGKIIKCWLVKKNKYTEFKFEITVPFPMCDNCENRKTRKRIKFFFRHRNGQ